MKIKINADGSLDIKLVDGEWSFSDEYGDSLTGISLVRRVFHILPPESLPSGINQNGQPFALEVG